MSEVAPAPPPRRRRWVMVALILSLAVNALLVGAVMRSLWHARANVALTGGDVGVSLPAFVNSLPAERRADLAKRFGSDAQGGLRPLRVEVRRARAEAIRTFTADPFDKQAFIAAQDRLFEAESRLRRAFQRPLPELGERMTAAERREYLAWTRHRGWGERRGRRGRDADDAGPDGPGPGPGRGKY